MVAAEAGANTQYGVISVQPTVVDNAAKKLTAYIMVWPEAGMFDNAVLRAQIGSTKLSGVFNAPANLTPGAINTVATTIDFDARVYDLWMNDEEHTDIKDRAAIYASFFRNHDNKGNEIVLNGNDSKTNPNIVASTLC